jgi:prepilin-type N-terminal cleavage/methylation domain-containing protein
MKPAPSPSGTSRPPTGFTLVETMVVLVLMGLMMGLAAPRMNGFFHRTAVDGLADRLVGEVAHARMIAIRQGNPVELRLASAGTAGTPMTLQIVEVAPDGPVVRRNVDLRDGDAVVALQSLVGGTHASDVRLRFNTRGLLQATLVGDVPSAGDVSFRARRAGYEARMQVTRLGKAYREH